VFCRWAGAIFMAGGIAWGQEGAAAQHGGNAPHELQTANQGARFNLAVITEVTDAGRAAASRKENAPVYYVAHDGGLTSMGESMGGERPPSPDRVAACLREGLAVNGYEPADGVHPAEILIVYRWGSYNREVRGFPVLERVNFIERSALAGGPKFGLEVLQAMETRTLEMFRDRSPDTTFLLSEADNNLYFVIASAYDLASAQRGEERLLWRTRTSTSARSVSMDEALPALISNAGPYFGRPMDEAACLETRLPSGRVEVGPTTVVGLVDSPLPGNFRPQPSDLEAVSKEKVIQFPFRD